MRLLIADDEEAVRESIKYLADFSRLGITDIHEASNGFEALGILRKLAIDIVLTDICMPGSDGIELMKILHEEYPSIKIIVISGYQSFDYARESLRNGAMDYLLKPIDPEQLNSLLRKAVSELNPENELISEYEDENFRLLKNYIEEHHQECITLDLLADKFGFNPSYLSRRFKQKFGIGIIDCLSEARIHHASTLLANTNLKIYDIAKHVGYEDEKYFSRVFSREMHMNPKEFRKKHGIKAITDTDRMRTN